MAQKVTVQLVDDIDGSQADSAVEFGLDGVNYTIDLSADNAAKLRDILATYVTSGRRTGGLKRPATRPGRPVTVGPSATDREHNQAIREWARGQGLEVSERGRIPAHIATQYKEANG